MSFQKTRIETTRPIPKEFYADRSKLLKRVWEMAAKEAARASMDVDISRSSMSRGGYKAGIFPADDQGWWEVEFWGGPDYDADVVFSTVIDDRELLRALGRKASLREHLVKIAQHRQDLRDEWLDPVLAAMKAANTPDAHDVQEMYQDFMLRSTYVEGLAKNFGDAVRVNPELKEYERDLNQLITLFRSGNQAGSNLFEDYTHMLSRVEREMGQLKRAKDQIEKTRKDIHKDFKKKLEDLNNTPQEEQDNLSARQYRTLADVVAMLEELSFS